MSTISPLPVAPRPFDDELLTSWQARVACHYGRTAAELELWLDPSSGPDISGFERRDFDPDEAVIRLWAEACRIDGRHIAGMALRRFNRPMDWYFLDHHHQAFCPGCLREDERAGRDHHIRYSWSCVEAFAGVFYRSICRLLQCEEWGSWVFRRPSSCRSASTGFPGRNAAIAGF